MLGELGRFGFQNLVRQQHARRFAADLAVADAARSDGAEIVDGEVGFGNAHEVELIADHGAHQHHDDLFQVVLYLGA